MTTDKGTFAIFVAFLGYALISLIVPVTVVLVAIHFIRKFW
jgi:hypothetical protein